ncbi:hypothetical protein JTM51_35440, partial [Pseudomonas aeruginosa]|nr:hypothetical protein [Pseudomonas aeruginosa]
MYRIAAPGGPQKSKRLTPRIHYGGQPYRLPRTAEKRGSETERQTIIRPLDNPFQPMFIERPDNRLP